MLLVLLLVAPFHTSLIYNSSMYVSCAHAQIKVFSLSHEYIGKCSSSSLSCDEVWGSLTCYAHVGCQSQFKSSAKCKPVQSSNDWDGQCGDGCEEGACSGHKWSHILLLWWQASTVSSTQPEAAQKHYGDIQGSTTWWGAIFIIICSNIVTSL